MAFTRGCRTQHWSLRGCNPALSGVKWAGPEDTNRGTDMNWQPINMAATVSYGTVAVLKMKDGTVVKAVWGFNGNECAWWPKTGKREPISKYKPSAFAIITEGDVPSHDWRTGCIANHAGEAA